MLFYGIFFLLFGVAILIWPELLAYMIAIFFIFMGLNILFFYFLIKPKKKKEVIIGSYKIVKE